MTPYITNSNFDGGTTDGWTLEVPLGGNHGIQDGSRLEYWAGNASNRAEASFSTISGHRRNTCLLGCIYRWRRYV